MKRLVDQYLIDWKNSPYRKPLLLRGARQVGKTYAVRQLGKTFDNVVEINYEQHPTLKNVFEKDLDPVRIIRDISLEIHQPIIPGETLLFFDEIQASPQAITALRYFYEDLPAQHIIAAGSLLDFAIQQVGIPVGRVGSFYMYPMTFLEFLYACNYELIANALLSSSAASPLSDSVHTKLLELLAEYLAIGGMPEVVAHWHTTRDPRACFDIHHALLDTYRQDFNKYAKNFQIPYLEVLFNAIPKQLGSKFKYSAVEGDYRKRELAPCLDLLTTAGIIHHATKTAGNAPPIGAEADPSDFKLLFLDVGLCQALLGLDLKAWFLNPLQAFANKGALVEAFVGQELLAYSYQTRKSSLFYWRRNAPSSQAEIDYVIQHQEHIIPIEVKNGLGTTLKSMHLFLESHPQSPYGIRFSTQNYSVHEKIHSYPLYAVVKCAESDFNAQLLTPRSR